MSENSARALTARTERTTLTQQIAQQLLDMIRSGRYLPGDRLPTESQLVAQMGVGRSCVREAMQWLTMAGAVDVRPRRGAVVRKIDAERLNILTSFPSLLTYEVLVELMEVRRLLEPEVARLAAERATDASLEVIKQALEHIDQGLDSEQVDLIIAGDMEFHNAVAAAAHNIVLRKMMNGVHDLLIESRRTGLRSPQAAQHTREGHRRIYEAIRSRNPEGARDAMRLHLEESRSDIEAQQPAPHG